MALGGGQNREAGRLGQENCHECVTSLDYSVRPRLKKQANKKLKILGVNITSLHHICTRYNCPLVPPPQALDVCINTQETTPNTLCGAAAGIVSCLKRFLHLASRERPNE